MKLFKVLAVKYAQSFPLLVLEFVAVITDYSFDQSWDVLRRKFGTVTLSLVGQLRVLLQDFLVDRVLWTLRVRSEVVVLGVSLEGLFQVLLDVGVQFLPLSVV